MHSAHPTRSGPTNATTNPANLPGQSTSRNSMVFRPYVRTQSLQSLPLQGAGPHAGQQHLLRCGVLVQVLLVHLGEADAVLEPAGLGGAGEEVDEAACVRQPSLTW
jgi:hypothetical protein